MNMKKCSKGHFYDADQYKTCPHCTPQNAQQPNVTRPITRAPHPQPVNPTPGGFNGNMVQCPNGHSYDASKFSKCPYCANQPPKPQPETYNMKRCPNCGKEYDAKQFPSCPYCNSKVTQAVYAKKVVGWLVAIKGPHKGKDFRLQTGRNFIGRDDMMDVCLRYDNAVSRNKHAVLLYEPKNCSFFLLPGESHELAYLNGEVLLEHRQLKTGDILSLGHSDLMFVPFCTPDFNWEKESEENKEKQGE